MIVERNGDRKRVENRIPVERSRRVLAVPKRRGIKREELVGERNKREGRNKRGITVHARALKLNPKNKCRE